MFLKSAIAALQTGVDVAAAAAAAQVGTEELGAVLMWTVEYLVTAETAAAADVAEVVSVGQEEIQDQRHCYLV